MTLKRIEIQKKFDLEELTQRLRRVTLKGFPNIEIYKDAEIKIKPITPQQIYSYIFTPQPTIYQTHLERIRQMADLFLEKGIDIFKLEGGVDYIAHDENEEQTQWTIIPPIVEKIDLKFKKSGLDYSGLLSDDLKKVIAEKGHTLNPELESLWFDIFKGFYTLQTTKTPRIPIICDGSHRVHFAFEKGLEQNLLVIDGPKTGYPYYAAPKPYSIVHVEPVRPEGGGTDKTHVLTEPGHKLLYRLFPTGGILSGVVRPGKH